MSVTVKAANQTTVKKKSKKNSKSKIRKKPRELNLKGWLATPQDWAQFDAWAKENAKPKKLIIQEPVLRCKKPLHCLLRRLTCLARPKRSFGDPQCVTRFLSCSALNAKASCRIQELALPRCREPGPDCREWGVNPAALCYEASEIIINLSKPKKRRSPDDCKLGDVVGRVLRMRSSFERTKNLAKPKKYKCYSTKIRKKIYPRGETSQLSAWMEYLALPSYKTLKDQETEKAIEWKLRILEEIETRGKLALEEKMKKQGLNKEEENGAEEKATEETEETDEMKKKRRIKKDPWRFTDSKCKEFPPLISPSALKHEASELTIKLAKPRERYSEGCKEDPLKVKESAKTANCSPRLENLAKPKFTLDPVKRAPPREKDEFGRPIFPPPLTGRVLPTPKSYEPAKCKDDKNQYDEENKKNEEKEKKEVQERNRKIDPIAYEPTIDPLFDPLGAKKQAKERKRASEHKTVG